MVLNVFSLQSRTERWRRKGTVPVVTPLRTPVPCQLSISSVFHVLLPSMCPSHITCRPPIIPIPVLFREEMDWVGSRIWTRLGKHLARWGDRSVSQWVNMQMENLFSRKEIDWGVSRLEKVKDGGGRHSEWQESTTEPVRACWLAPKELLNAVSPSAECFLPPVRAFLLSLEIGSGLTFTSLQSPLWKCQLAQESAELFTVPD